MWLNSANDVPFGWTLAHEIGHVAEKDVASGYLDFKRVLFVDLLSAQDRRDLWNIVSEFGVYEQSQFGTEIANNLLGDALDLFDSGFLKGLKNEKQIAKHAINFLRNLPLLNPDLLSDSGNDQELSKISKSETATPE